MELAPRDPLAARRRGGRRRRALGVAATLLLGGATWWLASAQGDPPPLIEPLDRAAAGTAREARPPSPVEAPAAAIEATREPIAPRGVATPRGPAAKAGTLLLHVLDSDTGVELEACETLSRPESNSYFIDESYRDRSDFAPLMQGDSPLQLVAPTTPLSLGVLRIEAPGHAAATLVVDWRAGGERTIELAPSADLTVVVSGVPPGAAPTVRVHDAARLEARYEQLRRSQLRGSVRAAMKFAAANPALFDELHRLQKPIGPHLEPLVLRLLEARGVTRLAPLDRNGRASFPRLAEGRWIVDVVTDDGQTSTPHAVGEITLRAGDAATLELEWRDPPARPLVRAAGRLLFHRGWFEPGMPEVPRKLHVRSLEPDAPDRFENPEGRPVALETPGRGDEPRFDAGELHPGLALARLGDWRWSTTFEVPPAGSEEIELVVPPPARVVVHGHAFGEPGRRVPFLLQWLASDRPRALIDGLWDGEGKASDDEHAVRLVVPQGDLGLWASPSADSRFMFESFHQVAKETEELVIEVRDPARIRVTLREGGEAIVVPRFESIRSLWFEARPDHFDLIGWHASGGASSHTLMVDGDGPAPLHLDPCDGYVMVAPVPVELKRGETLAVDLPVERARR